MGTLAQRVAAVENRFLDALRSPKADLVATEAPTGSLESFRKSKYGVLVSYRRDGTPVPSPLWFAIVEGTLVTHTGGWKVKRIAANPNVRVAPSTFRGRPLGPPLEATARALPPAEQERAERALDEAFGLTRRLYYRTMGRGQDTFGEYLEITPITSG